MTFLQSLAKFKKFTLIWQVKKSRQFNGRQFEESIEEGGIMIYGYVRISTPTQNLARQVDNIKQQYPDAVIVEEVYTGRLIARPNWEKLYKAVKQGDTIVFDEVSRMCRNAEDGVKVYKELYGRGVELVFLKQPHINTSVYRESLSYSLNPIGEEIADVYIEATNKVLLILAEKQIKLAFEAAESEIKFLKQRTKEGLAQAKLNGKQIGQVKGAKYKTKRGEEIKQMILAKSRDFGKGNYTDVECIASLGIGNNTFYKYKRELMEMAENGQLPKVKKRLKKNK